MHCQCVICTDHFDGASDIASVPCGHTFHDECLSRWLKANPTCPTCRVRVKQREVRKIYLMSLDDTITDSGRIANELSDARIKIHELRQQVTNLLDDTDKLKALFSAKEQEVDKYKAKYFSASQEAETLKAKTKSMKTHLLENQSLHKTITELRERIEKSDHLKAVLQGTTKDVEDLLTTYGPGEGSVRQIATFCVLIKRELSSAKSELRSSRHDVSTLTRLLDLAKADVREKNRKIEATNAEAAKFKAQCAKLAHELENLPERSGSTSGTKRLSDDLAQNEGENENKKTKLNSSLDVTVVPSPPVLRQRTGYLADKKSADPKKIFPPALVGYSKMKIVTGVKKPTPKTQGDIGDDLLLKMMINKQSSHDQDKDSKVRTGYNGLGGHSNHIQPKKSSIW
ncbi:TRAF-interacting protein-like [Tropilaelaps mercedesae]|uniref:TRAF-interacting protein-like n=1 Tax=Tropilaelaps mercedesae TaxID=418985 RepID=A0A1V9XAU7_9ACAR|nr:TRAF-interacting protein-like [Tropilaelaps mercedesae]